MGVQPDGGPGFRNPRVRIPRTGPGIEARERLGPVAERVGFEPTRAFTLAVFKTAAFNRSATSPWNIPGSRPSPLPGTRSKEWKSQRRTGRARTGYLRSAERVGATGGAPARHPPSSVSAARPKDPEKDAMDTRPTIAARPQFNFRGPARRPGRSTTGQSRYATEENGSPLKNNRALLQGRAAAFLLRAYALRSNRGSVIE